MLASDNEEVPRKFGDQRRFNWRQKILLSLITRAGYSVIWLLGTTMRFSVSIEEGGPDREHIKGTIFSFWHCCMLPAVWFFRNQGVRVMSSWSFDGEYTSRIIRKLGFVPVKGSSSKGALRAFMGMRREIAKGWPAAFTIDGPRGPKFVAKPGPVSLAKFTGAPMVAFHVEPKQAWVLRTWDELRIPKPFSWGLVRVSKKIYVAPDASEAQLEQGLDELQNALERCQTFAQENAHRAGTAEFPEFHW